MLESTGLPENDVLRHTLWGRTSGSTKLPENEFDAHSLILQEMQAARRDGPTASKLLKSGPFSDELLCGMAHFQKSNQ